MSLRKLGWTFGVGLPLVLVGVMAALVVVLLRMENADHERHARAVLNGPIERMAAMVDPDDVEKVLNECRLAAGGLDGLSCRMTDYPTVYKGHRTPASWIEVSYEMPMASTSRFATRKYTATLHLVLRPSVVFVRYD